MFVDEILLNPGHKMVFKCPFDKLVEDIRRNEFVDVGAREVFREWLMYQ